MNLVKDFPLGVLIIVLAFFPLSFSYWLANFPDVWNWMGILLGITFFNIIFNLGWKIAFEGVKIKDDKE